VDNGVVRYKASKIPGGLVTCRLLGSWLAPKRLRRRPRPAAASWLRAPKGETTRYFRPGSRWQYQWNIGAAIKLVRYRK